MTIVQAVRRVAVAVAAATLASSILVGAAHASSAAKHTLGFRPVLATLPAADARAPTADESAAITSCDPGRVQAVAHVPLTPRASLAGDACAVVAFAPHQGKGALLVGPAKLTAADVASARSTFESGQGHVIDLRLTRSGLKAFNRMATRQFSKVPPGNQVALVVDGRVFSNPAFQASNFSGPIQISGSFTGKEAKQLAATINRARRGA